MKNLVLISLFLSAFFLSACSPKITKSLVNAPRVADEKILYNMQIDFYKQHFSGLLFVKPTCRMVFNTHFGMGIFDVSVNEKMFQVNSIAEPLRSNKNVMKLLERDLRMLYCNDFPDFISIKSRGIKLQITMERIKDE